MRIVTGIFWGNAEGVQHTIGLMRWSLAQNPDFWRQAVLYIDPQCESEVLPYSQCFEQIIVDHDIPEEVAAHKKWNCKAWWAKKSVEQFGDVLFCDLDIYVRKLPDEKLWHSLKRSGIVPRFLDIPAYTSPDKVVGCGCTYYNQDCQWEPFLQVMYDHWHHDERAWTEALDMTRDKLLQEHFHMNPYIVDWDWLHTYPDHRHEAYIIHGISSLESGKKKLLSIGYTKQELQYLRHPGAIEQRLRLIRAGGLKKQWLSVQFAVQSILSNGIRTLRRRLTRW